MKRCSKCNETKALSGFPRERQRSDGYAAECKACKSRREKLARGRINAQQRQWEHRNPEKQKARRERYVQRHEAKVKARSDLNHAVERGEIVRPSACESCGGGDELHGHHADYDKPLEVEWLCRSCHFDRHNKN